MDKLLLEESENKISIFKILFLLFILSYTTNSYGKVKIYYINGIQNTWEMAKNSKDTLENNLMNSTHKIDATVKFIFNPIVN